MIRPLHAPGHRLGFEGSFGRGIEPDESAGIACARSMPPNASLTAVRGEALRCLQAPDPFVDQRDGPAE